MSAATFFGADALSTDTRLPGSSAGGAGAQVLRYGAVSRGYTCPPCFAYPLEAVMDAMER